MPIAFKIVKLVFVSWFFWSILTANGRHFGGEKMVGLSDLDGYASTSHYSLNSNSVIENGLINSNIVLLTAHPDDESMFFTPTLLELGKENYNNSIHIYCLSNGDYDGLGEIRARELNKASTLLGIKSVEIGDLIDDINAYWDSQTIINRLDAKMKSINEKGLKNIILTFDKDGVSNHPNHKSLNTAVRKYVKTKKRLEAWELKSWNFGVKYSGFFLTNMELISEAMNQDTKKFVCSTLQNVGITIFENTKLCKVPKVQSKSISIYSDINGWFLGLSTMTWAHYSQMVWFRWGWVLGSKYMNSNELIKF